MVLREKTKRVGDLLVHIESHQYNQQTAIINNPTASEVVLDDFVGYPLVAATDAAPYTQPAHEKIFDLAVAGQEASVVALFLSPNGETIPANTVGTRLSCVIDKPDGVVLNQNKLALLDVAGAAFNQTTLRTRLNTLGYKLREEPTLSEEAPGFSNT